MSRFHLGTFITGVVALALGILFTLEATGVWTLQTLQLRYLAPVAVIAIGVGVLLASLRRART
jgi:hypothetical protein